MCPPIGSCPTGQGFSPSPNLLPWGQSHPTRNAVYAMSKTGTITYTIHASFIRLDPSYQVMPDYGPQPAVVAPVVEVMPDPLERELAYAQPQDQPQVDNPAETTAPPTNPPGEPPVIGPQPPGTREQKWMLPTQSKAHKFYGALTEAADAADCLEKAVRATGARKKPGEKGRRGQMQFLFRSLAAGHGDPMVFFDCIMQEQAQDRAHGAFMREGRNAMRNNPYWRSPRGPGFGGWGTRMPNYG